MRGKTHVLLCLVILCIILQIAYARTGIGMTGCNKVNPEGECIHELVLNRSIIQTYTFNVYNYDNDTKRFTISFSGELENVSYFEPKEFNLSQHDKAVCDKSPGCQTITIYINASNLEQGNYTSSLTAETTASRGGALQLNQVLTSKLRIEVLEDKTGFSQYYYIIAAIVLILIAVLVITLLVKTKKKKKTGKTTEEKEHKQEKQKSKKEQKKKKEEN